jgi:hypothetical protein
MLANDLKKGARVQLRNGWQADVYDNAKGSRRMCKVYGFVTEIGSVYTHDITHVQTAAGWERVELSDRQAKEAAKILAFTTAMGF